MVNFITKIHNIANKALDLQILTVRCYNQGEGILTNEISHSLNIYKYTEKLADMNKI